MIQFLSILFFLCSFGFAEQPFSEEGEVVGSFDILIEDGYSNPDFKEIQQNILDIVVFEPIIAIILDEETDETFDCGASRAVISDDLPYFNMTAELKLWGDPRCNNTNMDLQNIADELEVELLKIPSVSVGQMKFHQ